MNQILVTCPLVWNIKSLWTSINICTLYKQKRVSTFYISRLLKNALLTPIYPPNCTSPFQPICSNFMHHVLINLNFLFFFFFSFLINSVLYWKGKTLYIGSITETSKEIVSTLILGHEFSHYTHSFPNLIKMNFHIRTIV